MNNSSDLKSTQADPFSKLISSYPGIYAQSFTFCVPGNWLENLNRLSIQINTLLAKHPEYSIEVSDVKEKYECLRFYYTLVGPESDYEQLDKQIEALIEQANLRIQSAEGAQVW
jgi:hypothetical protein